jgi:hypothetical protein
MIEKLIEGAGRRSFLLRMSTAATALVCSVLGIKLSTVQAGGGCIPTFCCCLCNESSGTCTGGVCSWCWYCVWHAEENVCYKYQCVERYTVTDCQKEDCPHTFCSRAVPKGSVACNWEIPATCSA